jgi:hypothetical protein
MYLFLDVETRGLYGETFAYGYVLTDDEGGVVKLGMASCPHTAVRADTALTERLSSEVGDIWLMENCLPGMPPPDCCGPSALRSRFRVLCSELLDESECFDGSKNLRVVADCGFPCEASFLLSVWNDPDIGIREEERFKYAPYPLLDLSTLLLSKGYDPTATYDRMPEELPAHNPLCDARQTMRLWFQLIRGEGVGLPK